MDAFELSIMIKRPIEESFAVLANLENDPKWHSAFVETRNTSGGSLGVGARFLVFEGLLGRRDGGTVYEVTEYEPNRIAAWKTVSGPLHLKFWRTFEHVDGGTRFALPFPRIYGWPTLVPWAHKSAPRCNRFGVGRAGELRETLPNHLGW
jgi:hypothetical protein